MPLGRLDPDVPEHALAGELDQFLGLADDVGEAAALEQQIEHLPAQPRLLEVRLGERGRRHSSITSPGR